MWDAASKHHCHVQTLFFHWFCGRRTTRNKILKKRKVVFPKYVSSALNWNKFTIFGEDSMLWLIHSLAVFALSLWITPHILACMTIRRKSEHIIPSHCSIEPPHKKFLPQEMLTKVVPLSSTLFPKMIKLDFLFVQHCSNTCWVLFYFLAILFLMIAELHWYYTALWSPRSAPTLPC